MKKLLLVTLLALALVLTVIACTENPVGSDTTAGSTSVGDPTETSSETSSEAPTEEPVEESTTDEVITEEVTTEEVTTEEVTTEEVITEEVTTEEVTTEEVTTDEVDTDASVDYVETEIDLTQDHVTIVHGEPVEFKYADSVGNFMGFIGGNAVLEFPNIDLSRYDKITIHYGVGTPVNLANDGCFMAITNTTDEVKIGATDAVNILAFTMMENMDTAYLAGSKTLTIDIPDSDGPLYFAFTKPNTVFNIYSIVLLCDTSDTDPVEPDTDPDEFETWVGEEGKLLMNKSNYAVGEDIYFAAYLVEGERSWIEMSGSPTGAKYFYVNSSQDSSPVLSGEQLELKAVFSGYDFPAGEYTLTWYPTNGYDDKVILTFVITDGADDSEESTEPETGIVGVEGQFTLNKTVYGTDEAIIAKASAGTQAWLELHVEKNGTYAGYGWRYVGEGNIPVNEEFDLRDVVYTTGCAYSFAPGKYKIIWYPTGGYNDPVVVEFEIQ